MSIENYVRVLADGRRKKYRILHGVDPIFHKDKAVGPVVSVVFDRLTGIPYESTNKLVPDEIPDDLHPLLQETLEEYKIEAKLNPKRYQTGYLEDIGKAFYSGYPHGSTMGIHAEVQGVSRALFDREAMGFTVSKESLAELIIDNRFPYYKNRIIAPCCPNCTALLRDVESLAGKRSVDTYEVKYRQWTSGTRRNSR
jgi:hypothetical protein